MSYTEITFFDQDGKPSRTMDVRNAWRGAMAIWNTMDERYLPPYIPEWALRLGKAHEGRYYRMGGSMDDGAQKEIWGLWTNEKVSRIDKIVFGSTLDWVVVFRANISELLTAFRSFGAVTSLNEQADIIEREFKEDNIVAVGWNQTSVCENKWTSFGWDEENEESIKYDLTNGEKHWDLFKELAIQNYKPQLTENDK